LDALSALFDGEIWKPDNIGAVGNNPTFFVPSFCVIVGNVFSGINNNYTFLFLSIV